MKNIANYICELDEITLARAKAYLNTDKIKSVKFMHVKGDPNEFEGFICDGEQVLMPGIEVDAAFNVCDVHCQCKDADDLCVHKVALLLAAQLMIDTNCPDYHMALNRHAANTLNTMLFPS